MFFALTKLSMPDGTRVDARRIYDFKVVHLFKCSFNLGPRAVNIFQAPRYLNPALIAPIVKSHWRLGKSMVHTKTEQRATANTHIGREGLQSSISFPEF